MKIDNLSGIELDYLIARSQGINLCFIRNGRLWKEVKEREATEYSYEENNRKIS